MEVNKNKKEKIIIIILALVIISLAAFIVYDKFIKKEDKTPLVSNCDVEKTQVIENDTITDEINTEENCPVCEKCEKEEVKCPTCPKNNTNLKFYNSNTMHGDVMGVYSKNKLFELQEENGDSGNDEIYETNDFYIVYIGGTQCAQRYAFFDKKGNTIKINSKYTFEVENTANNSKIPTIQASQIYVKNGELIAKQYYECYTEDSIVKETKIIYSNNTISFEEI